MLEFYYIIGGRKILFPGENELKTIKVILILTIVLCDYY